MSQLSFDDEDNDALLGSALPPSLPPLSLLGSGGGNFSLAMLGGRFSAAMGGGIALRTAVAAAAVVVVGAVDVVAMATPVPSASAMRCNDAPSPAAPPLAPLATVCAFS